jgi:hypothetical protein
MVFAALRGQPDGEHRAAMPTLTRSEASVLSADDRHITLWSLFELHYAGFDDVDDGWEWDCGALSVRRRLEANLEGRLRERSFPYVQAMGDSSGAVAERLFALVKQIDGPSVSRFVRNHASRQQMAELMIQRSIYNLKEADPHAWAIPRLQGPPKVALAELLYDEYGAGRPERQHARMFAETLTAFGLDCSYGAYINDVGASVLAVSNLMSMFGLNRRLRGASMGHLAAFEATSSLPARDISAGLARVGLTAAGPYFDEHVEADAVHEQVAARDICEVLVKQDPRLLADVAFGAAACLLVDQRAGEETLASWRAGRSALRDTSRVRSAEDLVPQL